MNETLKVQSGIRQALLATTAGLAFAVLTGCGGKQEEVKVAAPVAPKVTEPTDPPPPPGFDPSGAGLPPKPVQNPMLSGAAVTDELPDPTMAPKDGKAGVIMSAVDRLRARAESGDRQSAYILGYKYYAGEGITQDYEAAAEWLRKAANLNEPEAQHLLAKMYEEGNGVAQNKVLAYGWYQIAAGRDHAKSIAAAGRLSNELTDTELDEGDRLARDFVPE